MGAENDDDGAVDSGSAYIFTRAADGTWTQTMKLTASDTTLYGLFGKSVAISGDTAIVGASGGGSSAYIFIRGVDGTWTQSTEVTGADAAARLFRL